MWCKMDQKSLQVLVWVPICQFLQQVFKEALFSKWDEVRFENDESVRQNKR